MAKVRYYKLGNYDFWARIILGGMGFSLIFISLLLLINSNRLTGTILPFSFEPIYAFVVILLLLGFIVGIWMVCYARYAGMREIKGKVRPKKIIRKRYGARIGDLNIGG